MARVYCHHHHGQSRGPCAECESLVAYAGKRLPHCPFGADKPTCNGCPVHCYAPAMRERVREVMRYAGPRMIFRHPWLALRHLFDGLRPVPEWPRKRPPRPSESSESSQSS